MSRRPLWPAAALVAALLWSPPWCRADEKTAGREKPSSAKTSPFGSVAAGENPFNSPPPRRTPVAHPAYAEAEERARKEINAALDEPVQFQFAETPLSDVVGWLKERHEIPIEIDGRALEDVGLRPDVPITKTLKDISLRSALRLLLRDFDLTYRITHEVLLITTPERAEAELTTRVYPVGDVLPVRPAKRRSGFGGDSPSGGGFFSVQTAAPQESESSADQAAEKGGFSGGSSERSWGRAVPYKPYDFEALTELITSTVAPERWDNYGGPGTIEAFSVRGAPVLVIAQTGRVHERIEELLADLRQAAPEPKPDAIDVLGTPAADEKIRAALKKRTEMEFVGTPLSDVVDWLEQYHKIEIQIDTRALEDVGLQPNMPVNKELEGVSLGSALRLLLRDYDLTYMIKNEVLLITTTEKAESELRPVIYPVGDLRIAPDQLVEIITSTVAPKSWSGFGGAGSVAPLAVGGTPAVIVSQTQEVQRTVAALLARLRRL